MTIAAGKLKHRVMFQQLMRVQDRMGGYVEVWQDAFEVWASIKSGANIADTREVVGSDAVRDENQYKILIRFHPTVTPSMRIRFGARIFAIQGVRDLYESKEILELRCVERGGV